MLLFKVLFAKEHFEFSWEVLFGLVIMDDSVWFILFEWRIQAKALLYEIEPVLTLNLENGPSNLQNDFLAFVNWDWPPDENQCSKFGSFITNCKIELSLAIFVGEFDQLKSRVMPTDTYICYSHLTLWATTYFDKTQGRKINNMNRLWRAVCNWFYYHVFPCIIVNVKVQKRHFLTCFWRRHHILIECLTYLALKTSPYIRVYKWCALLVLLALQPLSYTLKMNPLNTSDAATWWNDGVAWLFFAQADTTTSFFCLFG